MKKRGNGRKILAALLAASMLLTQTGAVSIAEEIFLEEDGRAAEQAAEDAQKESERLAAEEAQKESERLAAEEAQRESERLAAEEAQKESERLAAEEAQKESERLAAEEAQKESERLAAEEAQKESERLAAEEAQKESERQAAEETQKESDRQEAEEGQQESELSAAQTEDAQAQSDPTEESGEESEKEPEAETEAPGTRFFFEDERVRIQAVTEEGAYLPQSAKLHADYMDPDSEAYREAAALLKEGLLRDGVMTEEDVVEFVLYDIYFLTEDGRIEPEDGKVKVTMEFLTPVAPETLEEEAYAPEKTQIVHLKENATAETLDGYVNTTADGEVSSLVFTSDSFSPAGLVFFEATQELGADGEGNNSVKEKSLEAWLIRDRTVKANGVPLSGSKLEVETGQDGTGGKVDLLRLSKEALSEITIPEYANFSLLLDIWTPGKGNPYALAAGDHLEMDLPEWIYRVDSAGAEFKINGNKAGEWKIENKKLVITFEDWFLASDERYDAELIVSLDGVVKESTTEDYELSERIKLFDLDFKPTVIGRTTLGYANFDIQKTRGDIHYLENSDANRIDVIDYRILVKAGIISPDQAGYSAHNTRDLEDIDITDVFTTYQKYQWLTDARFVQNDALKKYITYEDIVLHIYDVNGEEVTDGRSVSKIPAGDGSYRFRLNGVLRPDEVIDISYQAKIDPEMYEHEPMGVNGTFSSHSLGDETNATVPGKGQERSERSWVVRAASNEAKVTTSTVRDTTDGEDKDAEKTSAIDQVENQDAPLKFEKVWLWKGVAKDRGSTPNKDIQYSIVINEGAREDITGWTLEDEIGKTAATDHNQEITSEIRVYRDGYDTVNESNNVLYESVSLADLQNKTATGHFAGSTTTQIKYTFEGIHTYYICYSATAKDDTLKEATASGTWIEAANSVIVREAEDGSGHHPFEGCGRDTYGVYIHPTQPAHIVTKNVEGRNVSEDKIYWRTTIDAGVGIKNGSVYRDYLGWTVNDVYNSNVSEDAPQYHVLPAVAAGQSLADALELHLYYENGTEIDRASYAVREIISTDIWSDKDHSANDNDKAKLDGKYTGFQITFGFETDNKVYLYYTTKGLFDQVEKVQGDDQKTGNMVFNNALRYWKEPNTVSTDTYQGWEADEEYKVDNVIQKTVIDKTREGQNYYCLPKEPEQLTNRQDPTIGWYLNINPLMYETNQVMIVKDTIPAGLDFDINTQFKFRYAKQKNAADGRVIDLYGVYKEAIERASVLENDYFSASYNETTRELLILLKDANRAQIEFEIFTTPTQEALRKVSTGTTIINGVESSANPADSAYLEYNNPAHVLNAVEQGDGSYTPGGTVAKASAQATVRYKAIDKTYTPNAPYVTYTIAVNPGGANLNNGDSLTLIDEGMTSAMVLQTDTIQVKSGETTLSMGTNKYTQYSYQLTDTGFTMEIPDQMPLTITYQVYVPGLKNEEVSLANTATLQAGTDIWGTSGETKTYVIPEPAAGINNDPNIYVQKLDRDDSSLAVAGAEFAIYDTQQTPWVQVGETFTTANDQSYNTGKADGIANSYPAVTIEMEHRYALVEVQAPAGYDLPSSDSKYDGKITDRTAAYVAAEFAFIYPVAMEEKDATDSAKVSAWRGDGVQIINKNTTNFLFQAKDPKSSSIDIPVEKQWDNTGASQLPKSVTFTLWKSVDGGEETQVMRPNGTTPWTITLSASTAAERNWKGTFKNLPVVDDQNRPITYTVKEEEQRFYRSEKLGDPDESVTYEEGSRLFDAISGRDHAYLYHSPLQFKNTRIPFNRTIQGTIWLDNGEMHSPEAEFKAREDQPLEGITVTLFRKNALGQWVSTGESTQTDANGTYKFEHLAAGTYEVRVNYDEYVTKGLSPNDAMWAGENGRIDSLGQQASTQDGITGAKGAVISSILLPTDQWLEEHADVREEQFAEARENAADYNTDKGRYDNRNPKYYFVKEDGAWQTRTDSQGFGEPVGTVFDGLNYTVASQNAGFINSSPLKQEANLERIASDTENKIDTYENVIQGDLITYEVWYTNPNAYAASVVVTDPLEEGIDFVEVTSTVGSVRYYDRENGEIRGLTDETREQVRRIVWTIAGVPAYSSGKVSFTARVNETGKENELVANKAYVKVGNNPRVETNAVRNQVETYTRSLSGLVWLDEDHDGYLDEELLLDGIGLKLVRLIKDESGTVTGRETVLMKKNTDGTYSPTTEASAAETVQTDTDGSYHFTNLEPGDYEIVFDDSRTVTAKHRASPETSVTDPDHTIRSITLPTDREIRDTIKADDSDEDEISLREGDHGVISRTDKNYHLPDQNMGVLYTKSISGTVWLENLGDIDGSMDDGEALQSGITVQLVKVTKDASGKTTETVVSSTKTDGKGYYEFSKVESGDYKIVFDTDRPVTLKQASGVADAKNSKVSEGTDGKPVITSLTVPSDKELLEQYSGQIDAKGNYHIPYQNAGLIQYTRSLSGIAFKDNDKNGEFGTGDQLMPGEKVTLLKYDDNGRLTAVTDESGKAVETVTDVNGYYSFENLEPGTYQVVFGVDLTSLEVTSLKDTDLGSKISPDQVIDQIYLPTDREIAANPEKYPADVKGNYDKPHNNAGYIDRLASVSIRKVDVSNKKGLAGAKLQLKDASGAVVQEWTSTENTAVFSDLIVGKTYTIHEVSAPDGYEAEPNGDITFTLDAAGKAAITSYTGALSDNVIQVLNAPLGFLWGSLYPDRYPQMTEKQTEKETESETETETKKQTETTKQSETAKAQTVRTGDETPVFTWLVVLIAAAVCLTFAGAAALRRRKAS